MPLQAFGWGVVIIGHWNPAILTPIGIAKHCYSLPENTPIEVLVPLDQVAPVRVKHGNLVVMADAMQMQIEATDCSYESLSSAMTVGANALRNLPVTPVVAAGFNVKYRCETPTAPATERTSCSLDDCLADADYTISDRKIQRGLEFEAGRLNLILEQETAGACVFQCNFHRNSRQRAELIEWLSLPVDRVREQVERLLGQVLGLDIREVSNVRNRTASE
ncbi:MAG: hypothetical protein IMZ55_00510 [Acidobacteria bacterium]|nr:hypothetical protein [Planctomycetota bacterium]MBE3131929.1 hypothetical protein [Acidobacteriota bacterium]